MNISKCKRIGLGIDLEEISRFSNINRRKDLLFLTKIFHPKEIEYCFSDKSASAHLAARFAAKEAIIKAFCDACGIKLKAKEIEIKINDLGVPKASVSGHGGSVSLSITHTKKYALAVVLVII